MARWRTAARLLLKGRPHPGHCPICGPTVFGETGSWLRDNYICLRCRSIPRQRGLMRVLDLTVPDWRRRTIVESSPNGPASAKVGRECVDYRASQFFPGTPAGSAVDGVRCEDLRALTYGDESIDVVITQDVMEHVIGPGQAFREIARVLRPGGVHVFTVPIFPRPDTLVRVADDGTELMEPDYHDNPVGNGRSLVAREWGRDIVDAIRDMTGLETEWHNETLRRFGLRGEMKDVFVTRKPG